MHVEDHLAAIERDCAALLAAARHGPLDAPVVACPGWDVEQLVGHVGGVHRWVLAWLETGTRTVTPAAPGGQQVLAWFEAGVGALLGALRGLDPASTPATFVGPQPAWWWPRRQAHEASAHRWDAERAVGEARPVEPALAVDGVDELLEVFLDQRLGREVVAGEGETIHLHATDADGAWLLTMAPDGGRWEHAHAKGDVAVRASASDLFLLLWNRRALDGLDVHGDAALLERWRAAVRI